MTPSSGNSRLTVQGSAGCRESPISPDGPSDSDFLVDCGPNLDRYMFKTDGDLVADVPVDRHVGTIHRLKAAGLINARVTLSIAAFDIDSSAQAGVAPERDRVLLNGHEVGYLDGEDGEWVLNEFDVPVEWVSFPSYGGLDSVIDTELNRIEIEVDVDNPSPQWAAQIDWVSLHVYVTRPILLVHGGASDGDTWSQRWSPNLTNKGVPHHAIFLDDSGTHGVGHNSADIARIIDKLLRAWGVDKIHIQTHSAGGFWSRDYVENKNTVEKLVSVAPPHCGSPLFDLMESMARRDWILQQFLNSLPVVRNLTTQAMRNYNAAHGYNPSVGYTAIAGYWKPKWYTRSLWRVGTWIVGKGDAVVPVWSVHCLPYTDNFTKRTDGDNKDAIHTHQTSAQSFFDIGYRPIAAAMPQGPPPSPPGDGEGPDPDPDPGKPRRSKALAATISVGQTQSHSILVDEDSPVDFSVGHRAVDNFTITLVSPSGQRFTSTSTFPPGAGFDEDVEFLGAPMPSFHFDNPEVGEWTVEVTANAVGATSGTPMGVASNSGSTDYVVIGFLPAPQLTMDVSLEKDTVRRTEPLILRATLNKFGIPFLGVPVRAQVTGPDGAHSVVTLLDNGVSGDTVPGDGTYTASVPTPLGGNYTFTVIAEETRVTATPFYREGEAIATASTSLSTLDGPYEDNAYDLDGDNGADVVNLSGFVNVDMPGDYTVHGTLTDLSGDVVTTISKRFSSGFTGRWRYDLQFHGAGIYQSQKHGPYRVSLKLFEERGGSVAQIDQRLNVHLTRGYQWYTFQAPPPEALAPTETTVTNVSSVYGGTVNLRATLFTSGRPLPGKTVIFSQRSVTLGSAITDEDGLAKIDNAKISQYYGAGSHELRASFGGDPVYAGSFARGFVTVFRANQTIVWSDPEEITPLSELGPEQLNATVQVVGTALPGELTYDPPAGTVMYEGDDQPLTVLAERTDFYNEASMTVHIDVRRPSATLTWNTPAPIPQGTPLSATQLNATANMSGTFFYSPVAGTVLGVGTHTLTATFIPQNHNFRSSQKTVTLTVTAGEQTITWPTPAPITYGTPLGAAQLNATAQGALTYSPAAGTILEAGTHTLTVTAAATPTAGAATKSVTLVVNKAEQTISWATPAPIVYGTPLSSTQLNATAPVALTYSPAAGTILDAGTHTLNVNAAATANYNAASASVSLVVNKANQTITWATPAAIVYGTPLSATQLNATATAGALTYTPAAGTVLDAGTHTLNASAAATANYNAATASVSLVVNTANQTITWATPTPIVYGTPLSAAQLNATATAGALTYTPAAGAILDAGTHTLNASAAATANYNAANASVSLVVNKANQTITWTTPAPIVYGTPLSAAQLNATSTAGALTYTPAAGTILDAGTHTLNVSAAATANYNAANASVSLVVNKANQTITWATPAPIVYGTPLSATQLNATSTAGALTYTPAAGTILDAGTHTLNVNAAPTANYNAATASVSLIVNKANQTITWATPAPIIYGTPLSSAQLNATATAGALTYTPAAGTILDAGTHTLNVNADATSNYNAASASVTLIVNKANQTITWATPAPIVYGTPLSSAQLNATTTAGALTYTPAAGTILDAGTRTLSVTAAETANYNAASASVTLIVNKANQTITWATPASIVYGTPLSNAQLNATATAGALTYTPAAGTILDAGNHTLNVAAAETANYNAASSSVALTVLKAKPVLTWAPPATIVYGTALSSAQLNATANVAGTFTFTPPAGTILDAGTRTLNVAFAPDSANYENAAHSVTLEVAKADQIITWSNPASIVYGTPLSGAQLNATATAGALTYTPAAGTVLDAGSHTLTVAAAETANYNPASASVPLTVTRAPLSLVVDAKSKIYGAALPALTGTLTGVVNNDPIAPSYSTTATVASATGTYPIAGTLVDPAARLSNYDVHITPSTLTVTPAALLISANNAAKQYSDPLPTLTASFLGLVLGESPAVLSGTLVIQTTATDISGPGTYPIAIGGLTSSNYAISYAGGTLTVTQEDARVSFNAPLVATTGGTIVLSATVQDISATADANGDAAAGDIRKATLTFVDRTTGATLCTAPIGLVDASDARTGVATCTASATTNIGIVIGGWYLRDSPSDNATATISASTADSITGAGWLTLTGALGATEATRADVNVNLQYDKTGAAKGRFTMTYTNNGRTYEVATAAVSVLSIARTANGGVATIAGTATIRDITVSKSPVTIDAAAPIVIVLGDEGEPSTNDTVAVTVAKSDGGLWLSTRWNGTRTIGQRLTGGNLQVHQSK